MIARQVLLLIDDFLAHEADLNLLEEERIEIANVKIVFLPTNATSLCQLLNQGIIRAWKAYYRRQWLKFAIQEYEAE